MGSGIIYAVIVGLWALVLIPLWLRNHDRTGEARSIDRQRDLRSTVFGNSRRGATSRGDSRENDVTQRQVRDDEWHEPTAADIAAGRRRMVLAVLVGLLIGSLVLALLGVLPMWFVVLPVGLLGAFIVVARSQVSRAQQEAKAQARRDSAQRAPEPARREARPATPRYADVPARNAELPEVRRTAPAPAAAAASDGWDAVNAPLPTYVSAPRASRVPRVIDLRHTGEWSGEAMVEEANRTRGRDAFAKAVHDDRDFLAEEMRRALPGDDDAFFDQLAAETRRSSREESADGFFDQYAPRAVND